MVTPDETHLMTLTMEEMVTVMGSLKILDKIVLPSSLILAYFQNSFTRTRMMEPISRVK